MRVYRFSGSETRVAGDYVGTERIDYEFAGRTSVEQNGVNVGVVMYKIQLVREETDGPRSRVWSDKAVDIVFYTEDYDDELRLQLLYTKPFEFWDTVVLPEIK